MDGVIQKPYLLFLGDVTRAAAAKTGFGLRDWCPDICVGQWSLPQCTVDLGLPRLSPREAAALGARSMVIGVAPVGGALSDSWISCLREALEAGLDLVSGMHSRLTDVPELAMAAARLSRKMHDVRHPRMCFSVATGRKRPG